MKKRKNKFALTLLEIMIVIVLIGLIGSVIGFNMKGSLDEGRAFKTQRAMEQIQDILMLEVAKGRSINAIVEEPSKYLKNSGLVKDVGKILKDGWGEPFQITHNGQKIIIKSDRFIAYKNAKSSNLGKAVEEESVDGVEE